MCIDCIKGKYKGDTALTTDSCDDCARGKYNENEGSSSVAACTACGSGTYSTTLASQAVTDCQACPDNSGSPGSSDELNDCVANAGFAGVDGGTPTACDAGTFKADTGDAACEKYVFEL